MHNTYSIQTIGPLFCYGANENEPEIRPASIRGQLHQWFRLAGYSFAKERAVFGGIKIGEGKNALPDAASPLVVRVNGVEIPDGALRRYDRLPHKKGQGGKAAPKQAFPPGTRFSLHLLDRYGGLGEHAQSLLETVELWLLLGALGTRSTRCGGSLQWIREDGPATPEDFALRVGQLRKHDKNFMFAVLPKIYRDPEQARSAATDTLGGPSNEGRAGEDLKRLNNPLGGVRHELERGFKNRKTSPLKIRLYRFEDGVRLVAVWDRRDAITKNTAEHFKNLIGLLKKAGKPLGNELAQASWR